MPGATRHVLFLCTGNSARSILAEALTNHLAAPRLKAWSAGSQPKGQVHPLALSTLADAGIAHEGLRSKGWDEFAVPGAPALDVVITVCDNAAGAVCPLWPGQPVTAHWGLPDPAEVDAALQAQAFRHTAAALRRRIEAMLALPLATLQSRSLRCELDRIGRAST